MKWVFLLLIACLVSCHHPLNVKVYESEPSQGGLYRAQAKELILYAKSDGFYCLNQSDIETLLNFCETAPSSSHEPGPSVKVYQIVVAKGGLVRAQTNTVISFAQSAGYYCINPSDFEALLNSCLNPAGN